MRKRPAMLTPPQEPEGLPAWVHPRSFTPTQLESAELETLPAIVQADGPTAMRCFVEFFAARLRNPHTRRAYAQAVGQFLDFVTALGVPSLAKITPLHVAAYLERHPGAAPTKRQHLAAIRHLGDWLVTGHAIPTNPAASVRGPRHVVEQGKTPILTAEQVRQFLDAIPTQSVLGLRDRGLVAVLFFAGARISAALALAPQDLFREGPRVRIRLHEKGGQVHVLPLHPEAQAHLEHYLEASGVGAQPTAPMFRAAAPDRQLTERPLQPHHAWQMIRRRARAADLATHASCHTFRASAITLLRRQGATLEVAQRFAGHRQPKSTLLYDRTARDLPDAEIERLQI